MIAVLKSLKQDPAQEVETRIAEFSRSNEWATMHDMDSKIVAQDNRQFVGQPVDPQLSLSCDDMFNLFVAASLLQGQQDCGSEQQVVYKFILESPRFWKKTLI